MGGSKKFPTEIRRINLGGHCPFCLNLVKDDLSLEQDKETENDISFGKNKCGESNQVEGINFLWPYIRFGEVAMYSLEGTLKVPTFSFMNANARKPSETEGRKDEDRRMFDQSPDLCRICFEEIKILKGVHKDLVMIRSTLKERLKKIHGIILATEERQTKYGRRKFEEELRKSVNLESIINDTVKFLDFIRAGIIKEEDEAPSEDKDTVINNENHSGLVYPLTTCELLLPMQPASPLSICESNESSEPANPNQSGNEESDSDDTALQNLLCPEVKIEPSSDEDNEEQDQLQPSAKRESSLESDTPRKAFTDCRKGQNLSPSEEESQDIQDKEQDEIDDSAEDPDYAFEEEPMNLSSDEGNSDSNVSDQDPLSDPKSPKKVVSKKLNKKVNSEYEILMQIGFKRGRGRPRKYPKVITPTEPALQSATPEKVILTSPITSENKAAIIHEKKATRKRPKYKCEVCDFVPPLTFSSEVALVRHNVEEHGAKPLICKTCSEPFYTTRSLFEHEKREHPETTPDPKKYNCDLCSRSFASRFYVEQHKKVFHFHEKPFPCRYCEKAFTNQLGRQIHTKAFHLNEKYECPDCDKIFKYRHVFERHQELWHAENPDVIERVKSRTERIQSDTRLVKRGRPPKIRKNISGQTTTTTTATAPSTEPEISTTPAVETPQSVTTCSDPTIPRKRGRPSADFIKSMYTCELCPELPPFRTETSFHFHKREKHEEQTNKLRCRVCKTQFLTPRSLQYHQKTYHPEIIPDPIRIPCGKCDKTFSAMFTLRIHERVVHLKEKLYECDQCHKTFQNKIGLKFHVESIHLGLRYNCDLCHKEFKYESAIRRHKNIFHKFGNKRKKPREKLTYPCTVCQPPEKVPVFVSSDSLQNHMIVFHGADAYQCPSCEEKFPWRKMMLNHIKNVHEKKEGSNDAKDAKPKEKPTYTCEFCGKIYYTKENLKTHLMKKHDPDWPKKAQTHVCEICGKSYIHIESFKYHVKIKHRTKRDVICDVCGMKFDNPQYLRNHMKSHTTVRKFQCPHCPARFKRKDTCSKHVKEVHNRVKQRNVGIRKMHFAPYKDEKEPIKAAITVKSPPANSPSPTCNSLPLPVPQPASSVDNHVPEFITEGYMQNPRRPPNTDILRL